MVKDKVDKIGKWSEEKLGLLGKYLNAYTSIMKGQVWCKNGYFYIDAFAGSGKPMSQEEERYIDGSPAVALRIKYPFKSYIFIEKEDWRVERLKKLKDEFPSASIEIKQGDCNKIITEEIVPKIKYGNFNRGLIFLDPFGMNIEWPTIENIAKTRALEILMNFPVMDINRTVLVNNPQKLDSSRISRMNNLWGTEDWKADIYQESKDLFGEKLVEKVPQTGKSLGLKFQKRLKEVFPHVTFPLVMKNSNNAPLYCLISASHNAKGKEIVEDIFKRFERLGAL